MQLFKMAKPSPREPLCPTLQYFVVIADDEDQHVAEEVPAIASVYAPVKVESPVSDDIDRDRSPSGHSTVGGTVRRVPFQCARALPSEC